MISVAQQFNIAVALISIIPTWKLWLQYSRTKNRDFLIFGGVFASATVGLIFTVFASLWDVLLFYQFQYMFLNTTFFLLFLYSYRVLSHPSRVYLILGIIWFASLIVIIILWKQFEQPETSDFFFLKIPQSYSSYFPKGAGLKYNDFIIYSTGFRLLGDLFRVYAFVFNLSVYYSVQPVVPKERLVVAKKLWIFATSSLLLYAILILPWMHILPIVPNLLNLIGLVIIAFIALRIPEGLIISHAQMIRISDLYDIAEKYDEGVTDQQYKNLVAYMRGIDIE